MLELDDVGTAQADFTYNAANQMKGGGLPFVPISSMKIGNMRRLLEVCLVEVVSIDMQEFITAQQSS